MTLLRDFGPIGKQLEQAEVTYRKLDYWTRQGYLKLRPRLPGDGSGVPRDWPYSELLVAVTIGRLTHAGLRLEVAHEVARGNKELAPGVWIVLYEQQQSQEEPDATTSEPDHLGAVPDSRGLQPTVERDDPNQLD